MIERKYNKNTIRIILGAVIILLYFLVGQLYNPFIIWTILPIYIGYPLLALGWKKESANLIYGAFGFLIISLAFSLLYHLAWFFDWDGLQTGSSTSALLFIIFPVIAVILGLFGYLIGYLLARFLIKNRDCDLSQTKTI